MPRKPRTAYTATEKVAILRRHLIDHVAVSDLCDEYQIAPTQFYRWQRQFFENGAAAFTSSARVDRSPLEAENVALKAKLAKKLNTQETPQWAALGYIGVMYAAAAMEKAKSTDPDKVA